MSDLKVAAVQMNAPFGEVEANLSHARAMVELAVAEGAQLVVLPELFNTGYAYLDRNYTLAERLDGPTGTWIVDMARRLDVHLVGTFPARMPGGTFIVAMLAAPDGRQWVYRKIHVAMWENCYFDRGSGPLIADTDLGRIGLLICWDQVFADLARAYQGNVDLLCIPSSPPTLLGTLEDADGRVLAQVDRLQSLGTTLEGVAVFERAQVLHALCAGVPVVYAARCGTFHSPLPYGLVFLGTLGFRAILHILRATGTHYRIRCPMQGRSCILNSQGERIACAEQDGEVVLVATVQPGAPDPATLPPLPRGHSLVQGIPKLQFLFENMLITLGRRRHRRWQHRQAQASRSS